jgi:hypothetical protein
MTVFTVGNEERYDKGLKKYGKLMEKTGRRPDYAGGFAVQTADDASRLIEEMGKTGEWAVYELDADWDKDTTPSDNGWWHALLRDSTILRKIPM